MLAILSIFSKSLFMKSILCLSASLVLFSTAWSQIQNAEMAADFKEISKFGSRASGFEGFNTYHSGNVEGSQFFFPNWSMGSVTTVSNEKVGSNFVFLYDKVRQELFMKMRDSSTILLADKNQISSFTLNTNGTHNFVPSATYDPSNKGNFFEVLVKNEKGYTLLKLVKTKFVKADERDIEKQRLGEVYDSFQDQITYYIYNNGTLQPVALKERSILKALAPVKDKVSGYLAQHSGTIDESFLADLVTSLNN
jgi:hypothetical protein